MALPKNDKEWYDYLQRRGVIAPDKNSPLMEFGQSIGNAALNFGQSIGSTAEETIGYDGLKDYFKRKKAAHQNWEPDESYSAISLNPSDIARTLGSGITQSAAAVGTGIVATAATGGNPVAGLAAAGAVTFGQIYGDTVKDYRAALPDEDEGTVKGLAFVSSAGQSLLETVLGPEKMAVGITKKICTDALKETTRSMAAKMGVGFTKQAVSEGSEEVAQDFWNRLTLAVGKEQSIELPSWNEVGEQFFGGAIPGGFLGGIGGAVEHKAAKIQQQARPDLSSSPVIPDSLNIQPVPQMTTEDMVKVTPNAMPEDNAKPAGTLTQINEEENKRTLVNTSLVDSVAKELGLKVNYINEEVTGNEIKNGHYNKETGEIFINRNEAAKDPMETLGHEFKHFLNQRHGDLVKQFDELFDKGLNKEGQEAVQKTQELYGERGDAKTEVNANTFAQFWNEPDFWKDVAARAEAKQPGMGQKFITALDEFIKMLRLKLKDIGTPEAKELFDNLGELRASAVESLAEYKRRTGTSTDAENVVGVQGGQQVQSVPLSELNVDPERFQFKSKADKKTGVDESNQLGGEFDPKTAGNLYAWENKAGKKFVVNGHHRFQLAKDSGVKAVNTIVDRENDGVTADQARRNGVLINIRDEQGDISDYADFVRSEDMDEKTAEKEGVLAREKGRLGYQIGRYASDNLYSAYKSGDLTSRQTALIADIARGDEGIEAAGIKKAKDMPTTQLKEFLKLLKETPKQENEQGDLFGFDDSALKTAETLSKFAAQHIRETAEKVRVARQAVKNPETAKKMDVSVGKNAQKLLNDTLKEQMAWENWHTDSGLYTQLLKEAGIDNDAKAEPVKAEVKKSAEALENENNPLGLDNNANDLQLTDETEAEKKKREVVEAKAEKERIAKADKESKEATPDLLTNKEKAPEIQPNKNDNYLASIEKSSWIKMDNQRGEHYWKSLSAFLKELPENINIKPLGNIAYQAYLNISHDPEIRALQMEESYLGDIASFHKELKESGVKDIEPELVRYAEGLREKYVAWLSAKSRTMSSMITGPANFPVARNEKAMRIERNRNEELIEWDKKVRAAVKKRLGIKEPGTVEIISSDDPEAIDKLKEKLETAKRNHARNLEVNKIIRDKKMSGVEKTTALKDLGLTKKDFDELKLTGGYYTVNSNAEIRRLEGRITELERKRAEQTQEREFDGGKLIDNVEANRVQLVFDSKPNAETIQKLKSHGFKWSPTNSAWQRQRTGDAMYWAKKISGLLNEKLSISEAKTPLDYDTENFSKAVEDYKNGVLDVYNPVVIASRTPFVLQGIKLATGEKIKDLKITMPYDVFDKSTGKKTSTTTKESHNVSIEELKKIPEALYNPVMVFESATPHSLEVISNIFDKDNKSVMIAVRLNEKEGRNYEVNSVRSIYGLDISSGVEKRIKRGSLRYVNIKNAGDWVRSLRASGYQFNDSLIPKDGSPDSGYKDIIIDKGENVKRYSISRPTQVNPILEDGQEKTEYQNKLNNREYVPKKNAELNDEATKRIANMGGVKGVLQSVIDGDFKFNSDTAQRMAQIALNSEEYKTLTPEEKEKIADAYIDAGTKAGRELASRRISLLDIDSLESIQANVNAMVTKIEQEKPELDLRKEIEEKLDIDIDKLPEDIVNNPEKLDALLRELISQKATKGDKAYEWWINSILSAPTTHIANTIGNTANAVYELGFKRFSEALINMIAKRKDAATFGEFKEMSKAFDWKTAFENAKRSFDLEATTSEGKIESTVRTAIGGKLGRAIRIPGRLLRAADEFAKSIINPVESTAMAYREGIDKGLKDEELSNYIREQLARPNSKARQYGMDQALDMTFQEEPGAAVEWLMKLRNQGGITGNVLKYFLPFMKTPTNILRQGIRKSPLGILNLGKETVDALRGKREFDNQYIQHAAEQLLAWGAVGMFMGMGGDDDDFPFLTGSSAPYGSAEQKFKANKVPPYSIKIGDNYYSYKRIEPLATGLAFIADGMQAYKMAKDGEDGTKVMKKLIGGVQQLIVEKSYLDSIGEIYKVASDPERSFATSLSNFAASWMPNVVRSTMNLYDDNVSDNKSRSKGVEFWEDQFLITTNRMGITKASPKLDYFGREVTKDSLVDAGPLWPLMRMVPIQSVSPDDNMDKAEQLIWNYNQSAEKSWYPDVPAYYFEKGSKKYYFTRDDYQDYAKESGELAHKQIMNAINAGYLNVNKPAEKDIEAIKKIFSAARKQVKNKLFQQKRYSE